MDTPLIMMVLEFTFASVFRWGGMLILMWSTAIVLGITLALVKDFWQGK
jgi:hypothetical protein